jgi:hypothetical protein
MSDFTLTGTKEFGEQSFRRLGIFNGRFKCCSFSDLCFNVEPEQTSGLPDGFFSNQKSQFG